MLFITRPWPTLLTVLALSFALSAFLGNNIATAKPTAVSQLFNLPEQPSVQRQTDIQTLNQQFAASVVIPTYQNLIEQTSYLVQATQDFEKSPTANHLQSIEDAWLAAQSTWAVGNAFEFGPVHSLGYGPAITSPVDTAGINQLLDSSLLMSEASDQLQIPQLRTSLRGLDAIAYVLHDRTDNSSVPNQVPNQENRSADDFSRSERAYLSYAASEIHTAASGLLSVWQVGWNGYPAYANILASAGSDENAVYLSAEAGTEEIIRGIVNSLDVLTQETIPDLIESTNSAESIELSAIDLQLLSSTIKGIQLAYRGHQLNAHIRFSELRTNGLFTGRSMGLAGVMNPINAERNLDIQVSLATAMTQVDGLIESAEKEAAGLALTDALAALTRAQSLLETDVLSLVQN